MELQEVFIKNLRFYRKEAQLTQAELSLQIDKSFNYINGIECGVSFPPPEVIQKIAEVLRIRPPQLFDEQGCPENAIGFDKSKFISQVTDTLYSRIKADIRREMEEVLGQ